MEVDYSQIIINGKNLKSYGVSLVETSDFRMPYWDYRRVDIPNRIIPKYQKSRVQTPGRVTLLLYGMFTSFNAKNRFEQEILSDLNNNAVNNLVFNYKKDIEYMVKLENNIVEEILVEIENPNEINDLPVNYRIDLSIEFMRKK